MKPSSLPSSSYATWPSESWEEGATNQIQDHHPSASGEEGLPSDNIHVTTINTPARTLPSRSTTENLAISDFLSREQDYKILSNLRQTETSRKRSTGASSFLQFVHQQKKTLNQATPSDLQTWGLLPTRLHSLHSPTAFTGAKKLWIEAAKAGNLSEAAIQEFSSSKRENFSPELLQALVELPEMTAKEKDQFIAVGYQSSVEDKDLLIGANSFLAYLHHQGCTLAEATPQLLHTWEITPSIKGSLPTRATFAGAKGLCELAAQTGHLAELSAQQIAACVPMQAPSQLPPAMLTHPGMTPLQHDKHIALNYQNIEHNMHRRGGAKKFLAYLHSRNITLDQATVDNFTDWTLTPRDTGKGKGNLPTTPAILGAQSLVALASQSGRVSGTSAQHIAAWKREDCFVNFLHDDLANPEIPDIEKDQMINVHFQSIYDQPLPRSGANGFLEFIHSQNKTLNQITAADLRDWTLTPIASGKGKGKFPSSEAFLGAKALCASAAQTDYLPEESAQSIEASKYPLPRKKH